MVDFSKLKKGSGDINKLRKAVEQQTNQNQEDTRYWKCERDKAGNGSAIIRFLPAPPQDGDDGIPWVKIWSHGFKGRGGWYIQNSLTTLGEDDPVSQYNSALWATGTKENQKIARDQKRKLNYISNILVIKDPKNPDNNGKVFLFRYGTKIFEKIQAAMNPNTDLDEKELNPFDMFEGANFALSIKNGEGNFPNYDNSKFLSPSTIADGTDETLEKIWKQEHSLLELLDRKNFKSYAELKTMFCRAIGIDADAFGSSKSSEPEEEVKQKTVEDVAKSTRKPGSNSKEPKEEAPPWSVDDDDELASFKALAEED